MNQGRCLQVIWTPCNINSHLAFVLEKSQGRYLQSRFQHDIQVQTFSAHKNMFLGFKWFFQHCLRSESVYAKRFWQTGAKCPDTRSWGSSGVETNWAELWQRAGGTKATSRRKAPSQAKPRPLMVKHLNKMFIETPLLEWQKPRITWKLYFAVWCDRKAMLQMRRLAACENNKLQTSKQKQTTNYKQASKNKQNKKTKNKKGAKVVSNNILNVHTKHFTLMQHADIYYYWT